MNIETQKAISQTNPFDVIWMLEAQFNGPRESLENEVDLARQVVGVVGMFTSVFCANGYAGVVYELAPQLGLILKVLDYLQVKALAEELRKIISLANDKGLTGHSDEDEWGSFVAENGDFRDITQRDIKDAAASLAECLKAFVKNNPRLFEN